MNEEFDELLEAVKRRARDPMTRRDEHVLPEPALKVVSKATIVDAERRLGCSLHPFLARVYLEVGNGGFGPGYGLAGLVAPYQQEAGSVVRLYAEFRDDSWRDEAEGAELAKIVPSWPEGLLPLFDWGGAIWSCLDANSVEGRIVTHDADAGAVLTEFSITTWFAAWAAGVSLWPRIYEECAGGETLRDSRTGRVGVVRKWRAIGQPFPGPSAGSSREDGKRLP